ncbi:MAG: GNAT family N-acetyltransferase [Rhodospirillales bacterium]|nr:GNAT family N-acetyltransferase [Rhodospirillales bacterium]MDE2199187.1 GNAT family N-acetyltransferase [Rhodospirillales bacterium]MDE2577007.1 GNAT family N-acetyltransferase [Rhodospirillales bacterium]
MHAAIGEAGVTDLTVTTVRARPDLLPVVAEWLWREWWQARGRTLEQTVAVYAQGTAEVGAPQTFVLLERDVPVGTVTMARQDLEERPQLTPWLAGVFVVPEHRGRGHVRVLFEAFERACRAASVETAWLYTNTAERIYLRAGWETVELIHRPGRKPVTLMRRTIPRAP